MTKYAKFNNETSITYAPQNYTTEDGRTICNFNTDPNIMLANGFKPVEEAQREADKIYDVTYQEMDIKIVEVLTENVEREIWEAKDKKLRDNDMFRDQALNGGINYKDILFDSDTDQKVNLSATYASMTEEDTIVWFGMDNDALLCTKEDIKNIGDLIFQLTTFCWTKNKLNKDALNTAETLEEVEAIDIHYEFSPEAYEVLMASLMENLNDETLEDLPSGTEEDLDNPAEGGLIEEESEGV